MSIRVMLADSQTIVRQGLRSLLEKDGDIEVVGEAEDGETALKLAREMLPDVAIVEVVMPNVNGIEFTRQITAIVPGVKVIGLSMYTDKRKLIGMVAAGASGYLSKNCAFEKLVQAIRATAEGRTYLSPDIVDVLVKQYLHRLPSGDPAIICILTNRETVVLQLLAEGKSVRETASQLTISIKTVETHRKQIMRKLGINSIAELTKYAIRQGLTSADR